MFLQSSEYLRELYRIKVLLILYDIFVIFLPFPNNAVFTFIFPSFSARYKLFVSVLQWLACLFSLPVFRRYNPTGLRRMCQLDYLNLWRYLWRQSLILSFLMLETEMKDNRMKRSSRNALLRLQHHRITIHIIDTVDGLKKKKIFWAIFDLTLGLLHSVFPLIITINCLAEVDQWELL